MKYLITFFLLVSTASAGQLTITRIPGTYGTAGEFNIILDDLGFIGGVPALNDISFQSFCVEKNEYVGDGVYYYQTNVGAIGGGVDGQTTPFYDPLSPITAWLYQSFIEGTLVGYNYGVGRVASADALQDAIWYSEDELPDLTTGADFYNQALAAQPTGIGKVRVLNLFSLDGSRAQDQIVMEAPEPPTYVLIGICVTILGLVVVHRGRIR